MLEGDTERHKNAVIYRQQSQPAASDTPESPHGTRTLTFKRAALRAASCDRIYEDTISGTRAKRPGLTKALEQLRDGDTLVVWKLDRLGRSVKDLVREVLAERLLHLGQRLPGCCVAKEKLEGGSPIFSASVSSLTSALSRQDSPEVASEACVACDLTAGRTTSETPAFTRTGSSECATFLGRIPPR
ncbi:recombinase family protein [Pseudarthrobacter oxydans]